MTTPWREFELLVTRIEAALAPLGATVKSPDRILDRISGNLREVDASIKLSTGGSEVLVTLECRDRQGIEDNTWIEQLVTKRDSIGAVKTIAVSSRGFSEPALRKAAHYGIEARVMREIEPADVVRLLKLRVRERCYRSELRGLRFGFAPTDGAGDPPQLSRNVLDQLKTGASNAPIFHRDGGDLLSWNDMWKVLQQRDFAALYGAVRTDGAPTETRLHLNFSDGVFVETVSGTHRVLSLDADLALFCEERESAMSPGRSSEYLSPTGPVAHAASYATDVSFGEVRAFSVTAMATQQVHLSFFISPSMTASGPGRGDSEDGA